MPVDKSDSVFILHVVVFFHSRRTTFWSDTLVCFDCFPHSAFRWLRRMCKAMFSVWDFLLPLTFLVEINIHLSTLGRLVQLVCVHPKARVMLKVWKESSAYQSSQIRCVVIRVFMERFGLNEKKKRTGLVSGRGHDTHWPLDPKERWYFIGKCKPPGSWQEINIHATYCIET